MLWQDFYDVCTWGGEFDRLNNLTEAEFLIGRVRHHPGILIWCGGNESLSFYHWAHDGLPMPGKEVLEKQLRGLCSTA